MIGIIRLRATFMLLCAAFIWGITFVAQKSAMEFVPPVTFNGVRCLLGAFSLFITTFFITEKQKRKAKDLIEGGCITGLLLGIATTLQQVGISLTTAGKAGFITSLYIVLVAVFSVAMGRKVAKTVYAAIFFAVSGLYFLSSPTNLTALNRGDLIVLISTIFFALHIIAVSKYTLKTNPIKLSCVQFFVAGVLSTGCGLFFEAPSIAGFSNCMPQLFCAGVLSCAIAFTLQIAAQKHIRPYTASIILSTEAIFSAILGFLILNEILSAKEIFGCICLLLAVYVAQYKNAKSLQNN